MRKFIIAAAMATAAVAATPASAQDFGHRGYGPGPAPHFGQDFGPDFRGGHQIRQDIERLDFRIDRAQRNRMLSPREAFGLRRDVQNLRESFFRMSRNGLDRGEARFLTAQVDRIQFRLRSERWDRDDRRF